MQISYPYLSSESIERSANKLITRYSDRIEVIANPPVPVEEILELWFEYILNIDDLQTKYGLPDVLGATSIPDKQVFIDASLDPTINHKHEGRYRFTVAHEIGHIALHTNLVGQFDDTKAVGAPMLDDAKIVCRSSQRRDRGEAQADRFAACLLMPEKMVSDAWKRENGDLEPYVVQREVYKDAKWSIVEATGGAADAELDIIAWQFAEEFGVSGQAMRIRLENLGLIRIRTVRLERE